MRKWICMMNQSTYEIIFLKGLSGSVKSMYQSIQRMKSKIDEHIKVYPSHTYYALPGQSMEYVKQRNIYFCFEEKQFIAFRMRKNQKNLFRFK